jgi:hypothetical protein
MFSSEEFDTQFDRVGEQIDGTFRTVRFGLIAAWLFAGTVGLASSAALIYFLFQGAQYLSRQ